MKRLQLLGLGILAMLAVTITATSAAQAAVTLEILPAKVKFTFASVGGTQLSTLGGKKVECAKVKGTGEATSARLGIVTFVFETCKSLGFACTGLKAGETSGNITAEGEWHLRHLLSPEQKEVAIVILPGHVHFTCIGFLFLVLGCVSSDDLLTKENGVSVVNLLLTSMFAAFLEAEPAGSGDQKARTIDTDNSLGMETCELLTKESAEEAKKYESSAQVGKGTITIVGGGTALIDLTGSQ